MLWLDKNESVTTEKKDIWLKERYESTSPTQIMFHLKKFKFFKKIKTNFSNI